MYELKFFEFEVRIKGIAEEIKKHSDIKNIYGISRGGLIPAVRLSHLTGLPLTNNPNKNYTVIIDDCIDSGQTKLKFKDYKYYFVLIDKQKENINEWIAFWWEVR